MMGPKEGVIKFRCYWDEKPIEVNKKLKELISYRNKLFTLGFIGVDESGIGFGNVSIRSEGNAFFISGSGTGSIKEFDQSHVALVAKFDIDQNMLYCKGLTRASSESLTHAIIYKSLPDTKAIVHIHNKPLWLKYLNVYPTTSELIEYGTPEMAMEIRRLLKEKIKVVIMGGHEDGIITYGKDLKTAYQNILNLTV